MDDDEYWVAYRKRVRRRANAYGMLILGPIFIIGAVAFFVRPLDLPAGDIRNTLGFRLVFLGLFLLLGIGGLVESVRWLIGDRRRG